MTPFLIAFASLAGVYLVSGIYYGRVVQKKTGAALATCGFLGGTGGLLKDGAPSRSPEAQPERRAGASAAIRSDTKRADHAHCRARHRAARRCSSGNASLGVTFAGEPAPKKKKVRLSERSLVGRRRFGRRRRLHLHPAARHRWSDFIITLCGWARGCTLVQMGTIALTKNNMTLGADCGCPYITWARCKPSQTHHSVATSPKQRVHAASGCSGNLICADCTSTGLVAGFARRHKLPRLFVLQQPRARGVGDRPPTHARCPGSNRCWQLCR